MKKKVILSLLESVFSVLRRYAESTTNTVDDVAVNAGIDVITAVVEAGEDKD